MRINSRLLLSPSSESGALLRGANLITPTLDLRIWRDEHMGLIWRMAYNDGQGETLVSFPDTAAMGDFIAEQLGLTMIDALDKVLG